MNLTPLEVALSTESNVNGQLEWAASALSCHEFFKNWYQDMLENPSTYGLPVEDYPDEAGRFDRCIKKSSLIFQRFGIPIKTSYQAS